MPESTQKTIKRFLPLIGISLFAVIVARIGVRQFFEALISVNIPLLGYAAGLTLLYLLVQTVRWQTILASQGIAETPFPVLFLIQVKSVFYGIISPARLGSFIKVMLLQDTSSAPPAKVLSGIVAERLLDLITMAFLASLGALFFLQQRHIAWAAGALLILFVVVLSLFPKKDLWRKLFRKAFYFIVPEAYQENARSVCNDFFNVAPRISQLCVPFVLSLVNWWLIYSQMFLISRAFNIAVPYVEFLLLMPITTVIALMPVTVAGLGTKEITLLYLFRHYADSPEKIVSFSVTNTVLVFCIYGILFLSASILYPVIRKRSMKKSTEEEQ